MPNVKFWLKLAHKQVRIVKNYIISFSIMTPSSPVKIIGGIIPTNHKRLLAMVLQELEQEEIHSNYCNRWNWHPPFQHHLPLTTASISILLFKIQAVILLRLMLLTVICIAILWHHTSAMMFTTNCHEIIRLIGCPKIPTICCQSL